MSLKRKWMLDGSEEIPLTRRCELFGLNRSSLYYEPRPESSYNEELMRLIDEQFTRTPFYGVPRMTAWLEREGHGVNHKRVRRLMRAMGLAAIYPKPRLSIPNTEHRKYPYLLGSMTIDQPDQVWCTDITYIRMRKGFMYLAAVMDWASRYVLSWKLSNTLEADFCLECLEEALALGIPGIFNSDQGVQFTCKIFTERLLKDGIRISMDGKGRVFDNIFVERLWRSVKYEEVYIHDYQDVFEAKNSLGQYFIFYNMERPHQALGYMTPLEVWSRKEKLT